MPIKPETKSRYPKNWKEISKDIRFNRAENKCEFCGIENYSVGYWIGNKFITVDEILNQLESTGETEIDELSIERKPIKIVLTVAHLDHTPENCDYSNLKALCQKCHNKYDSKHRKQTRKNTRNEGQLSLLFKYS